jgi:hypothetical protein
MAPHFINVRLLRRLMVVLAALVLLGAYSLIHYEPSCKKYVSEYLSYRMSKTFKTPISVEFDYCNPFTATFSCKNIHAEKNDWICDIQKIHFCGSWISLITQGHFDMECFIEGGKGSFEIHDGSCSIIKIIKDFIDIPSEKPFIVTSLHFKKSEITVAEKKWALETKACVSVSMKMQDSHYYVQHVLHWLNASVHNFPLCSITNGSGDFLLKDNEPQGSLYYTLNSTLIPEGSCIVYGVCSPEHTYLNMYSFHRTWDINLSYADTICILKGSMSLSQLLQQLCPWIPMEGDLAFDMQWHDGTIDGELLGNNLWVNTLKVPPIKCTFNYAHGYGKGNFIFQENEPYVQGSFATTPEEVTLHASSCSPIALPWFTIEDKSLLCSAQSNYQDMYVTIEGRAKQTNATEYIPFAMKVKGNATAVDAEVHVSDYELQVKKDSDVWLLAGSQDRKEFINGTCNNAHFALHGTQELYKIIGDWINVPLSGNGVWKLNGVFNEETVPFEGSFDGQLKVGDYYNLVEKVRYHGFCNLVTKEMYVESCESQFRTGVLAIKNALYRYDTEKKYCTIPIQLQNFLITKQNEFFVQLNGCMYLHGPLDQLQLKGFCIADKSLITGNILSTELYKESSEVKNSIDIACDVVVLTKNEIPIKTPLFKTDARCFLQVTGSIRNPHLLGSIDFNNGSIYFPYDSLFIKKGMLQFNAMSLEPAIELIAKNSLKNYDITLGLHGTILNPVITLTSSPLLTKEQLIALLLGGSEDGSLSLIMPHTMTELFEQLLFGSTATISKTQKYLHSLFEPLKSVRLVPKFSDQTGRGGLRGALEIEVTDRLKASIQQNFSLTEDTRVDISYALSDEANIKVTKDERGDVGGEIEMKWRW